MGLTVNTLLLLVMLETTREAVPTLVIENVPVPLEPTVTLPIETEVVDKVISGAAGVKVPRTTRKPRP